MLASVRSAAEAMVALDGGADIIDAKEPERGALGAVAPQVLASIRAALPSGIPVSATIGDIACGDIAMVLDGIDRAAAAGADIVKIGLFPPGDPRLLLDALSASETAFGRRVLVMLADRGIDFRLIEALPAAGFAAVMLDTAEKSAAALPDLIGDTVIRRFVLTARQAHLSVGLAGALRLWHIPELVRVGPDILGFRGALCRDGRSGEIDAAAVAEVAKAIRAPFAHCAAE